MEASRAVQPDLACPKPLTSSRRVRASGSRQLTQHQNRDVRNNVKSSNVNAITAPCYAPAYLLINIVVISVPFLLDLNSLERYYRDLSVMGPKIVNPDPYRDGIEFRLNSGTPLIKIIT